MSNIKIEGWSVKDFRNLSLVDIEVKDYILKVSGKNGAGKSSVLEAIFIAILGPRHVGKNPERMIKEGKDKATIVVKLKDGERELEITRIITKKGMKLTVKTSDGSRVTQAYLSGLINMTMIDPISWANSEPAEMIADLKEKAGIDTSLLETDYDKIFEERKFQNREVKRLNGVASSLEKVELLPDVMTVEDANAAKISVIQRNSSVEKKSYENDGKVADLRLKKRKREDLKVAIANYTKESVANDTEIEKLEVAVAAFKDTPLEDIAGYDEDIAMPEDQSAIVAINKKKEKADADLVEAEEISEESTKRLEDIKKEIIDVIEEAELPFDDISFDSTLGVLVGGLPVSEHSTAEKIKIAVTLNAKFSPHLKVIYVKDGSLLDKDTLLELEELSISEEMLFLVELVLVFGVPQGQGFLYQMQIHLMQLIN